MNTPAISVLMSVHNGEHYARQAIDSVLSQTFGEFEFIIIDDGSEDNTPAMLESYTDPRIHVETNPTNIGLTPSLNKGLRLARGRYIARIDADDICEPTRFSCQSGFLDQNPDYVICGSSYLLIDENGSLVRRKIKDFDDTAVRWIAQFRTPIDHSTAMFRTQVLHEHGLLYNEKYRTAQDYDYWLRLLDIGKGHVLAEPLMQYRMHDDNVTRSLKPSQKQNLYTIATENFRRNWPELQEHAAGFDGLLRMYHREEQATPASIRDASVALSALMDAFARRHKVSTSGRVWIARQSSGIFAEAVLGKGRAIRQPAALFEYIWQEWRRFPALLARWVEDRQHA